MENYTQWAMCLDILLDSLEVLRNNPLLWLACVRGTLLKYPSAKNVKKHNYQVLQKTF